MREIIQHNQQPRSRRWLAVLGVGAAALLPACGSKTETAQYDLEVTCPPETQPEVRDVIVNSLGGAFTLTCNGETPLSVSIIDGPGDKVYDNNRHKDESHTVEVVFEDYSNDWSGGEASIGKIATNESGTRVVIDDIEDFERIQVIG